MGIVTRALVAVVALGVLAGCGGKTLVESDLGVKGAPDWVNQGTQILNDRGGRLFHGVGQAPELGDASLQVSTADNRARAELARVLSSYMDVVGTDYTAAVGSGEGRSNQQSVSQQIQNLTKVNLSGARVIAHWKDPKTRAIYSLAELDLKQIKAATGAVQDMNPGLREHLAAHGDNLFDRLTQEKK
ncbi:MAG: LPP20 family lipoprotein [Deferrisomatales bacterium]